MNDRLPSRPGFDPSVCARISDARDATVPARQFWCHHGQRSRPNYNCEKHINNGSSGAGGPDDEGELTRGGEGDVGEDGYGRARGVSEREHGERELAGARPCGDDLAEGGAVGEGREGLRGRGVRGGGIEEGEGGGGEFPLGEGDELEDAHLEVGGGDEAGWEDGHDSAAADFAEAAVLVAPQTALSFLEALLRWMRRRGSAAHMCFASGRGGGRQGIGRWLGQR